MTSSARSKLRLRARSRFRRIFLEQLEDRSLLTSIDACSTIVVNTNDSGAGSLRDAINCSNSTPGTQTISFNIPGGGVHAITPITVLPAITDTVIIDGYTQPGAVQNSDPDGFNGTLLIELHAPSGANSDGLVLRAGNSTIRGLIINRAGGAGIFITNFGGLSGAGTFNLC